nr:GAF domain-containing protein [bacterium]
MEGSSLKARSTKSARTGSGVAKRITLSELATTLQHSDARAAVSQLLSLTAETFGAKFCAWYIDQRASLRLGDAAGPKSSLVPRILDLPGMGHGDWSALVNSGEMVHRAKSSMARTKRRMHVDLDCNYLVLAPVLQNDRNCGILLLGMDRTDGLTKAELDLVCGAASLLSSATTRLSEHQRLREAQAKLRTIMRSSAEYAILTTSEDFEIVEQNTTAIELLGRDGSGSNVAELVGSRALTAGSLAKIRKAVQS